MLSWDYIVNYIKDEMSFPDQFLELSDDDIKEYLKDRVLRKFEKFFPDVHRITLDTSDSDLKIDGKHSEFYLVDPDDRTIFNVKQLIPGSSERYLMGHPIFGTLSYGGTPAYHLDAELANNAIKSSPFNYTIEFRAPNELRISPLYQGKCVIEYERSIDAELTDLDPELEQYFLEYCLGHVLMRVGRLRRRYSNIQTPFGDIQLDAESIYAEGQEIVNKLDDLFNQGTLVNVVFDVG